MLGIQPAAAKSKNLPLDDGGVYCGDEDEDNEDISRNTADAIPKITIASGSSISITIAGDSSIGGGSAPRYVCAQSVRKSSKKHFRIERYFIEFDQNAFITHMQNISLVNQLDVQVAEINKNCTRWLAKEYLYSAHQRW